MEVVYLFMILGLVRAQNSDLFELNILHYNDFHAHFEELSPHGGVCNPTQDPCIGGFSRLYTAIRQGFEAEPDSVLLNGGDTFQGTIWYNFMRWNVSQHFMNMLEHDAHVLGNHEFDHGVSGLVPYLETLKAPMLGANVNVTLEPTMAPYIKNHVVIRRKGRRIGIIGVLLKTFSAPIGQVILEDEAEAINREAAILTAQGVDIIIVLSHVGFFDDQRLASVISSDVDIIVGAHTHTFLYTGESPSGDTPSSDYPTVVVQSNGHRIPIVQAYCYTRYLGMIKLYIDDKGIVQSWEGQPVYLGSTIVKDPRIEELMQPWREEVNLVAKEVLGRSLVTLNRGQCSNGECNMGNWICDAFLEEVMPNAHEGDWTGANVALVNAGGLRTQINAGDITTEGLLMAMPFENFVQLYDLKGKYILEALEFSLGVFQSDPTSFYSSRMLQVGGMRNVYNASAPVGARVVSASVRCISCAVPRYDPLDPDAVYRVVTQDYIGDGGGGFTMLSEHKTNNKNIKVDYEMLQDYLRKQKVIFKDLDGRIEIVY